MDHSSPPDPSLWKWRLLFRLCALALGIAIFFVCTRPLQTLKDAHYPQINEWFDLGNHLIAFFVWNGILRLGFGPDRQGFLIRCGLAFGAACEFIQLTVPTRGFQWMDMGANTLPVLLYWAIPPLKQIGADTFFPLRHLIRSS